MVLNNYSKVIKKKIAVIGLKGLPAYGGAATVGENLINNLCDKYDFTVYSVNSHTDLKSGNFNGIYQFVIPKCIIKKLNTFYYYIVSSIHCMIKNYDIVHLHHNDTGLIAWFLSMKYKNIVYTSHSTYVRENFKKYEGLLLFLEKIVLRFSKFSISVSKTTYDKYQNSKKNGNYYIPNGVNKVDIDLNIEKKNEIAFAAGRIIPSKGCHILLESLKLTNINIKLKVYGDLSIMSNYKSELLSYESEVNVDFCGLIKDKNKLLSNLSKCRLFIFPSSIEAMSMMLLEMAAIKVPIICSNIKENRDIFNEDEVLFFNVDDPYDLKNKIEFAYNNNDTMVKLAERAYNKVLEKYLWKNIALEYEKIYEKCFEN